MSEPGRRAAVLLVRQYVAQAHAAVRQRELAALAGCGATRGRAPSSSLLPAPSILALVRGLTTASGRAGAAAAAAAASAAASTALRPSAVVAAAPSRALAAPPPSLLRRLRSTLALDSPAAAAATTTSTATITNPALRLASPLLPESARRSVALWLAACAGWTFSMVVLGGATRLTRSGLSMTDWKFSGERLPLTPEDWDAEFAKYRASPEYRLVHSHMTVDDFKFIFAMEYAHRMWGRLLGLGFALPALYFAVRGSINGPLGARLGVLMAMGGAQGLVGWWMVRSGLKEPRAPVVVGVAGSDADANAKAAASSPAAKLVAEGGGCEQVPRVSPYRLAAHLTSAFAIYATLVWTSLSLWQPVPAAAAAAAAAAQPAAAAALVRRRALPLAALVGVTAASGAFVAGLDAGHAYNTFPTMNGQWIPDDYWGEHGAPRLPWWRNAFENTAAVQLHHRALAVSTLAAATGLWLAHRRLPLPGNASTLLAAAAAVTWAQAGLGVATLLTYVPPTLGALHQAGALTVFTALLALLHGVRPAQPSAGALLVSRMLPPLALAGTAAIATAVVTQY